MTFTTERIHINGHIFFNLDGPLHDWMSQNRRMYKTSELCSLW